MKFKKAARNSIISAAVALAVAPGAANAALATWTVNYADAMSAGGGYGGASLHSATGSSALIDEYLYTAESVVNFQDNDSSGTVSAGDTFDDYIALRLNSYDLGGNSVTDDDVDTRNVQLTASVVAHGLQVDQQNYIVTSADISFFFDMPLITDSIFDTGDGSLADFSTLSTLFDGLLVQTGTGSGAGVSGAFIPDGAINIDFALVDVLSTLTGNFGAFELFNPLVALSSVTLSSDSNNKVCGGQGSNCASTVGDFEATFGFSDSGLSFHTRSDGSATKNIPEPASLALLGIGLLGLGAARRKKA